MNSFHHPSIRHRLWRTVLALLLAAAMLLPGTVRTANAGKEGVFLSDDIYFTLEEARLSPGDTNQSFRFTLELVNHSNHTVDYNKYGAAVLDADGNRYGAELTEKLSSRIKAGSSVRIRYVSRIPAGLTLQDLRTQIFQWNFDSGTYIDPIGELSVAGAVSAVASDKPTVVIGMNDVDSSYSGDAIASIQAEDAYKVLAGDTWSLFVHLSVENLGAGSFKLPSSLQLQLKDADGLTYTGTVVYGGDLSILPRQKQWITVQFPVGDLQDESGLSLEIGKKASAGSTTGASGTAATGSGSGASAASGGSSGGSSSSSSTASAAVAALTVLGSTDISGLPHTAAVGDEADYSGKNAGLKSVLSKVTVSNKTAGVHLKADFTLTNKGTKAVPVPVLTGLYQLAGSTLSAAATDSLTHPSYLAVGESTPYRFEADFPSGVDVSAIQLAVQEKKGTGTVVQDPVFLASLPAGTTGGGPVDTGGDVYNTTVGKLALSVNTSYRLMTDSGEDVILSEVTVENKESAAVKLPALVSVFNGTEGDLNVDGKVVRVQSSPYLSPGQKTVLYVYAKVPYSMALNEGTFTFGEGSSDAKSGEITVEREWATLPFKLPAASVQDIAFDTPWFVKDPERQSTARVIDSKVYDSTGGKIAAVRILQQNQETRAAGSVPYAGYFLGSDGTVWTAKATEDTGHIGKDGYTVSTLWVTLPNNMELPQSLVFGPKVDDVTFSSPHKVTLEKWTAASTDVKLSGGTFAADLAPYHVKFTDMSREIVNNAYKFHFTYSVSKDAPVTEGSFKNRYLSIQLEDESTGKVYKTWDIPVDGAGSFTPGEENVLTVDGLGSVADILNLVINGKMTVYDKFEGGTRLLGTISKD